MSGKPSPEGAREALAILCQLRNQKAEIDRQRARIAEAQEALKEAERAEAKATKELWLKLERMDLVSSGNYGFENRMTWFLRELVTAQTVAAPWSMPTPAAQPMPEAPVSARDATVGGYRP